MTAGPNLVALTCCMHACSTLFERAPRRRTWAPQRFVFGPTSVTRAAPSLLAGYRLSINADVMVQSAFDDRSRGRAARPLEKAALLALAELCRLAAKNHYTDGIHLSGPKDLSARQRLDRPRWPLAPARSGSERGSSLWSSTALVYKSSTHHCT